MTNTHVLMQVTAVQDGKLVRWCSKPAKALAFSEGGPDAEPAAVLNVVVWGCRGLLKGDAGGKSDPYVKVKLLKSKLRTQMVPNTINPNFHKKLRFDVPGPQLAELLSKGNDGTPGVEPAILKLKIMDQDLFGSDDFLGQLQLDLAVVLATKGLGKVTTKEYDLLPK
jgi:Ca2+-dependent lipid-binding protein